MIRRLLDKAEIGLLRRRQFGSRRLRRLFRDRHGIDVGLYSYGCFDPWRMPGPIRIGRYCSFASTVRSAPVNHPMTAITTHPLLFERRFGLVAQDIAHPHPLVIEDDVWAGHYALILPGCRFIGRGAVIGAGAVVTKDVPAYAVVAGNPAAKIRDRFDHATIAALERSRWWELDPAQLRAAARAHPGAIFRPDPAALAAWARA